MASDYSICLGTAGWGVWHSPDGGASWLRHRAPFPLNSRIQALAAHPTEPQTVFAGGDTGLFVSRDGGAKWERRATPDDLPTIWSLAIDPVDPNTLFAGTRPAGVYRSRDGGHQWELCPVDIAAECSIGTPFVTSLTVDPDDHLTVWAGVEIDGVFRSVDGGDSWTHMETGLYDPDIHDMALGGCARQPRLGQYGSRPLYQRRSGRDLAVSRHQRALALALRAGHRRENRRPRGVVRGLRRNDDRRNRPYSAQHGRRPDVGRPATAGAGQRHHLGIRHACGQRRPHSGLQPIRRGLQPARTRGESWSKVAREFGEIRCIAWLPN